MNESATYGKQDEKQDMKERIRDTTCQEMHDLTIDRMRKIQDIT